MKLRQQFTIAQDPPTVWNFLEQFEAVAACLPGMESIEVVDPDHVLVRVTQRIGPMSATFDVKVTVVERSKGQSLRFEAGGKSVRGAVGSVRSLNAVSLAPCGVGTQVTLEGDIALAGALGSVGQKVVSRQAARVTEQFAANLQTAIASGGLPLAPSATADASAPHVLAPSRSPVGAPREPVPAPAAVGLAPSWLSALSAAASIISAAAALTVLSRLRRCGR